jgi:hypothetical protein
MYIWLTHLQFIVGQVTPSMIIHLTYGTYIFFGLLTFMGAAFIWIFFPETKGLSLEEMDILFGSAGVAAADAERMREINKEVGLEDAVRGNSINIDDEKPPIVEEKARDADSD